MARWLFLAALFLPIACLAPLQAGEPRVDALGDPLPQDAIARLGSARFRVAGWTRNLAFTHDDRTLVGCLNDAVVTWDRASGKELRRFAIPDPDSTSLSADAKFLALLDDRKIRIIDTSSGKEKKSWPRLANPGHTVRMVFSHDGKTLAVSADDQVVLYDWAVAKKLVVLSDAKNVNALALSPDGRWLATTAYRRPLEIWDAATGKRIRQVKTKEEPYPHSPAFSRDSARIAWHESGRIKTVEVASGELGPEFASDGVEESFLFTADGKQVISGAQGPGVQLWDLADKTKKCDISTEHFRYPVLALSKDGKTLAIGDSNGDHRLVRLYDLVRNRELPDESGHPLSISAMAFSSDGKTLATADRARFLFWDARTGERRRELPAKSNYSPVFSPDLKRAARLWISEIRCVELDEAKKETEWKYDGKETPRWAAFTRDQKRLITTRTRTYYSREEGAEPLGKDGLLFWDIASGKTVRSLDAGRDTFFVGLILTPDGRMAVTPDRGGKDYRPLRAGDADGLSEGGPDSRLGPESRALAANARRAQGGRAECSRLRRWPLPCLGRI